VGDPGRNIICRYQGDGSRWRPHQAVEIQWNGEAGGTGTGTGTGHAGRGTGGGKRATKEVFHNVTWKKLQQP
jgi:hypothetical protein